MYWFRNDYSEGAHPLVMEALNRTNAAHTVGYGADEYCERARAILRERIGREDAAIYFIPGGTQTNLLMIGAALKPFEAVVAADSGHINVHETGAIEATGHKVLTAPSPDGKLRPRDIQPVLDWHTDAHMVKPAMVYVSDLTEVGTAYTRAELEALSRYCREKGLLLYLDGARLASALAANDLTLGDIARLCDCFYIGGTKSGALMGEALVLTNDALKADFAYHVKQRGALFAKGRLLGVQFAALFADGLYEKIGAHENEMARILRDGLKKRGCSFMAAPEGNMVFPIVPERCLAALGERCQFEATWRREGMAAIRLVASWATTAADAEGFLREYERALGE